MKSPVLVALDYPDQASVLQLVSQLSPELCRLKVGKELFTRCGPALVETLQGKGFDIFLDLKYHDIPNTVAGAVRAAADLGVWMVNVHASGGCRMMEAAAEALQAYDHKPILIAVTVLTSLSDEDLLQMGDTESAADRVMRLAALAQMSGMDGVVCSALEAASLRRERGEEFCLVTPGIRLAGDASGDQRRIVTPGDALANGSDYLVIGRSITASADPGKALERVLSDIGLAE
jgi:orotidine-5'-phosphate decarboxylase